MKKKTEIRRIEKKIKKRKREKRKMKTETSVIKKILITTGQTIPYLFHLNWNPVVPYHLIQTRFKRERNKQNEEWGKRREMKRERSKMKREKERHHSATNYALHLSP